MVLEECLQNHNTTPGVRFFRRTWRNINDDKHHNPAGDWQHNHAYDLLRICGSKWPIAVGMETSGRRPKFQEGNGLGNYRCPSLGSLRPLHPRSSHSASCFEWCEGQMPEPRNKRPGTRSARRGRHCRVSLLCVQQWECVPWILIWRFYGYSKQQEMERTGYMCDACVRVGVGVQYVVLFVFECVYSLLLFAEICNRSVPYMI